jgi:hypothetical protein
MFLFVNAAHNNPGGGLEGHVFLAKSRADAKALLLKEGVVTKRKFKVEDLIEVSDVVFHEPDLAKRPSLKRT